jgi:general stress protein 26
MIEIDADMHARIDRAIDDGKTIAASYVDPRGLPHISFYGSTHVHGKDQLALWASDPKGALVTTLADRPHMALIYGDIGSRVYYMFEGQARIVTDSAERDRVYDEMHAIERQFDADRGGVAIVVELDKVTSLSKAGKIVQTR